MRKREFMDELKKALDGNVSTQTYYDTINYYENPLRMMAATTPAKPAEAVRRAGM